ncbi:Fc.00g003730.m01.CDS01 [Cosmosporella sp. VM-42]
MAPALFTTLRRVVSAATTPSIESRSDNSLGPPAGPLHEARMLLTERERHTPTIDPSYGTLDPHDISNVGFFVLFALIGVAFVCVGIWFFFWAKNGGFQFKENDWDDYKTTVLRRRGPNGTLLSGATPSTNLGGGSVYKDVDDDTTTVVTESTALSGITAGASDVGAREKRRKKQEKRDREREKRKADRKKEKENKRHVGEDGVLDDEAEVAAKKELRNYRHEKAARVGGINKESEGSTWDGSTNPTESTVSSELLSNRQSTPTTTPTATPTKSTPKQTPITQSPTKAMTGGIRKVYSVADRRDQRESERLRQEARRMRDEGRARRDFSYQNAESSLSESLLEGSSAAGSSDLGTKSYHHPMPELREIGKERDREKEREERRARRAERAEKGGYRRGRGEDY